MNQNYLFVDVDTQHDFCAPDGALFVCGAPAVLDNVRTLVEAARSEGHLLVGSVDTHDFSAWEFEGNGGPFPAHCVKGTAGWLKVPGTRPERTVFVPVAELETSAKVPEGADAVYFEKEVYSLFVNPRAEATVDALLTRRGWTRADTTVAVFGIATDYCVKAAALGFAERGFDVVVVEDAIAAVAPETGHAALQEMTSAGCRLQTTRSLI